MPRSCKDRKKESQERKKKSQEHFDCIHHFLTMLFVFPCVDYDRSSAVRAAVLV